MNQIGDWSKYDTFANIPAFIRSVDQDWSDWAWLVQPLADLLRFVLIFDVFLNFSTQHRFNLLEYFLILFVWLYSVLQSLGSGLPSHRLLVFFSWLLSALFDQYFEVFDCSWDLVTVQKNFCHVSDLLNLSYGFFKLLAANYLRKSLKEVFSLYFLLFPCIAGVNPTQSLPEVFSFVSFKDLFLEIGPIEFSVRLTINGGNDPFKNFISFGFSVLDINFGKNVSVNFGGNLDSFFPLS